MNVARRQPFLGMDGAAVLRQPTAAEVQPAEVHELPDTLDPLVVAGEGITQRFGARFARAGNRCRMDRNVAHWSGV